MKWQEVERLIQAHAARLRRLGVVSLSVFGSVARNEAAPDSDVDFLVEFDGPTEFGKFMDLKAYLENLLGRRVDLVTPKALRPRLRSTIHKDLRRVA